MHEERLIAAAASVYITAPTNATTIGDDDQVPVVFDWYTCAECAETFTTYTSMQMHATAKHGTVSQAARKSVTPWCPVCLLLFESNALVTEHVGKSKLCALNLLRCDDLPDDVVVDNLRANAACRTANMKAGWHKCKNRCSCYSHDCVQKWAPLK